MHDWLALVLTYYVLAGIDVAADQMTAEPIADPQRSFEIDGSTRRP